MIAQDALALAGVALRLMEEAEIGQFGLYSGYIGQQLAKVVQSLTEVYLIAGDTGEEKKALLVFNDSPDLGPDCLCSRCLLPIDDQEAGPPIRWLIGTGADNSDDYVEVRLHPRCSKSIGLINQPLTLHSF